jgi:hypothetical protein
MFARARENFVFGISTLGTYFTPSMLSFGTSFSTAGQSLFGTMKICDWVFGLKYDSLEDEPDWANQVRQTAYALVIAANVIIIIDTRYPAIFRSYFKKNNAAVVATTARDALESDLESIYNEESEYFIPNTSDEQNGGVCIVEVVRHFPAHDPANGPLQPEINIIRRIPEQALIEAASEDKKKSLCYHFTKSSISGTLKFLGFCSISFASINTFLGSITLFEYLGVTEPFLKYSFSTYTVASKFYSSYSYVYKTATVKSAEQLARWLMNERDPLADPNIPQDRWQDVKNYMSTIALSFFNIISSPFLAFYSTMMTLGKIPFIRDYDTFIYYFSAASTFSSFTNDVISKSPSVHKLYIAWRSKKEDGSLEMRALEEADLKLLRAWNGTIIVMGINDSLATGANIVVSVINTSNFAFHINKYNPELFAFAAICGVSSAIVNYAFSVRRGHRDFLKFEVYPFLARHGYLIKAEEKKPLPDIKEKEVYKIMAAPKKEEATLNSASGPSPDVWTDKEGSIHESLLAPRQQTNGSLTPTLRSSSPLSRLNIFYRSPLTHAVVEDITPVSAYTTLVL